MPDVRTLVDSAQGGQSTHSSNDASRKSQSSGRHAHYRWSRISYRGEIRRGKGPSYGPGPEARRGLVSIDVPNGLFRVHTVGAFGVASEGGIGAVARAQYGDAPWN